MNATTNATGRWRTLTGWGRTAGTLAEVRDAGRDEALADAVRTAGERGVLPRGLGRSYGDTAQNAGGLVLDMCARDAILGLDGDVVTVECGVSLDTLMRYLLPHGLWIPVLPGTRQVTVGGAIAADVHGGNHHSQGSFCEHVLSLDLLLADGSVHTLTPEGTDPVGDTGVTASELFWATAGGLGLTGIVLRASIRLKRVETSYFLVDVEQVRDFDELLTRLQDNDDQYTYSKSWFDSVVTGKHMGRGTLQRYESAKVADLPEKLRAEPLKFDAPQLATLPDAFPSGLLNKLTARMFNELWYRKSPTRFGVVQNITEAFHPLDIVGEWNRVYGRRGFVQYQFVVPFGAEDALRASVELMSSSGHVSALNVLKRFGEGNRGPLSFPTAGWTLAVDMPVRDGLHELFESLDELVLGAGGRLYLAKESRTTPEMVQQMYPRIDEWRKVRAAVDPHGVFASDMSRRLML